MSVPPISPLVLQDPSVVSVEETANGRCCIKVSSSGNPVSRIVFPILTQTSSASRSVSGSSGRHNSLLKQAVKQSAIEKCYASRNRRRRQYESTSSSDSRQSLEEEARNGFSISGSSSS